MFLKSSCFFECEVYFEKLDESLQIAALLLSCASFGILILSLKSIESTVHESDKLLLIARDNEISWEITAADGIFSLLVAFNSKSFLYDELYVMISLGRISDGNLPQVLRKVSLCSSVH